MRKTSRRQYVEIPGYNKHYYLENMIFSLEETPERIVKEGFKFASGLFFSDGPGSEKLSLKILLSPDAWY
jgi:hypothetical protein